MAFRITVQKGVRIDATLYATHVAMFCQVMRKTMAEVVKEEARLLARDACDMFPPFSGSEPKITKGGEGGFGNKARDKGRAAVNRDIRKIFAPLDQAPGGVIAAKGNAYIFHLWVESKMDKNPPSLPSWIINESNATGGLFGLDIYKRFVESRHGNLSGNGNVMLNESEQQIGVIHRLVRGKTNYRVNKNRKPDFYIHDWKLVENYIKKTQERVGKLKAGWYHAGLKLGSMPTSGWIKDQGSSNAICNTALTGPTPKVRIGNAIGKKHTQGWHLFQKAWNHRGYAMRVRMLQVLSGPRRHGTLLELTQKLKGFDVKQLP
jgi:hypothetical protein